MIKQRKRNNYILIVTIALLILLTAVLAYLNAGNLEVKRELQMNAEFLLTQGANQYRITMQDILNLSPVDFTAVMNTSTTSPTPVELTGVELHKLLQSYNVELKDDSIVQVRALDGYASAVSSHEILTSGNIYVCIHMNGEVLKPKSEAGFGPYLMVIKNEQFSQRWCKFVEEIVVP